jgi:large subunit ribosomal protein L30
MAEDKAPPKTATKKAAKPAAKKAAVKKAAAKPAAAKPAAAKPAAAKPAAVKPAAVKPAAVKPAAVKPAAKAESKPTVRKVNITLIRSKNGRLASHKACVAGLGLRRMHQTVEVIDTPENRGMINKVRYLLNVKEA